MKTTARMMTRRRGMTFTILRGANGEATLRVEQQTPVRRRGVAPLQEIHDRLKRLKISHNFTTALGKKVSTLQKIPGTTELTINTSWGTGPGMPPVRGIIFIRTHQAGHDSMASEHTEKVEELIAALKARGIPETRNRAR